MFEHAALLALGKKSSTEQRKIAWSANPEDIEACPLKRNSLILGVIKIFERGRLTLPNGFCKQARGSSMKGGRQGKFRNTLRTWPEF